MAEENTEVVLHFQIGIIKDLHKQNLLTEEQMSRCIDSISSKYKAKEKDFNKTDENHNSVLPHSSNSST